MSAREFGRLTDREFSALWKRHEEQHQRDDYRAGVICSLIYNLNRDPKKSEPLHPHDFFATLDVPKKQRKRRMNAKDIFQIFTGKSLASLSQKGNS